MAKKKKIKAPLHLKMILFTFLVMIIPSFIFATRPDLINDIFIGYDDVKDDLTGNYAIDKQIVREGGEINFMIIFMVAIGGAGLTLLMNQILDSIWQVGYNLSDWIKRKFHTILAKKT